MTTYISNNSNVQIIIGTLDVTPLVDFESVKVDDNVIMTNNTMDLTITINPGVDYVMDAVSGKQVLAARPRAGQQIIWHNPLYIITAPDGSQQPYREFAGVITEVRETEDFPNLKYEIKAQSYVRWFDRHLVVGSYGVDYPQNMVRNIVNRYCPGFTTYNVQSAPYQVSSLYYDYKKPSEAIKEIADMIEWGFYIDYYKDVHFYPMETFSSPLPHNILDVDNDVVNYGDLEITENGEQQMNKIFIRGFKTRHNGVSVTVFTADGNTDTWNLGYRISSAISDTMVQVYTSINQYNQDKQNFQAGSPQLGTQMTLARDIVDGTPDMVGQPNTAYINYTNGVVRIPNFNNNGKVPNQYVVAVRYHIMKEAVFLAQDPQAQGVTASLEQTDGVYESTIVDKSLTNSTYNAVKAKGMLMLMKYRYPQISGKFTSYISGWKSGQFFQLVTKRRFGGINEVMYIQRVQKSIVKNDSGEYVTLNEIEFADSPYLV